MKLYTAKAVAVFLGLTERRIGQLRDEGIISEIQPNLYNLQTVTQQYIKYIKGDQEDGAALDYKRERALLVKSKREKEEINLDLMRKKVIDTVTVEQVMSDMLIKFRSRILSVPAKLAPELVNKKDKTEIFKLIKNATDEALEELSEFDKIFDFILEEEKECAET